MEYTFYPRTSQNSLKKGPMSEKHYSEEKEQQQKQSFRSQYGKQRAKEQFVLPYSNKQSLQRADSSDYDSMSPMKNDISLPNVSDRSVLENEFLQYFPHLNPGLLKQISKSSSKHQPSHDIQSISSHNTYDNDSVTDSKRTRHQKSQPPPDQIQPPHFHYNTNNIKIQLSNAKIQISTDPSRQQQFKQTKSQPLIDNKGDRALQAIFDKVDDGMQGRQLRELLRQKRLANHNITINPKKVVVDQQDSLRSQSQKKYFQVY